MTVNTNDLITHLVADTRNARALPHPVWRATTWLLVAAGILTLLAIEHGVRPDLAAQWRSGLFLTRLGGSLATGVLASVACMMASVPDRSRLWLLLPVPALALWLSGIGYGCLTAWIAVEAGRTEPDEMLRCFATLLFVSLPLSGAMFLMLRHATRLRPSGITLSAGLAVGAMAAFAMTLLHPIDATIMVLVWNLGIAAVIAAVDALVGVRAMAWFERTLAH